MSDVVKYYSTLFDPGEYTCWSDTPYGTSVESVDLALRRFQDNYVCINPLYPCLDKAPTRPTHSATVGRRADVNVAAFRNILCEFDTGSVHEQELAIKSCGLPYSTLVFSGGKSLHAVISLQSPVNNRAEYKSLVRRIYDRLPTVDKSGANPSRFTRAPGAMRGAVRQVLLDTRPRVDSVSLEAWLGPDVTPEPVQYKRINIDRVLSPYTELFLMAGAPEGGWNNQLFRAAADMTRAGYSKQEIYDQCVKITGYLDDKDIRTIDSAYNNSRQELE